MSEPLLELIDVRKQFGGLVAVDGLSLALPPGQVTALIGPNGAGKTTVVNLIAGRLVPDSGEVRLRGRPLPRGAHRVARAGVGRLFQEVRVFGSLTVRENVAVAADQADGAIAALSPRRESARIDQEVSRWLEFVGLADRAESLAGSLSYGQQKLVAVARLLIGGFELLLLDEPASGINPRRVAELAELVGRIVATGRTVLLIEHNMGLVRAVSHRVVLLDRGVCRACGGTESVWASPAFAEVYELAGPA